MVDPPIDASAMTRLVSLVQRIVNESGNPEGFDAHAWTLDWLTHPVPALGMARPAEYMQTEEGLVLVERLLLQVQSGAYS